MEKYTKENLENAVKNSVSVTGVLRYLKIKLAGGSHKHISERIKQFKINTNHFTGKIWNKGKPLLILRRKPEEVLVNDRFNGRKDRTNLLRRAMIESGFIQRCNRCKTESWMEQPLVLTIHHKNGNNVDNRKDNLEFLCPNCHSQTENFVGKNRKKKETKIKESRIKSKNQNLICACGNTKSSKSRQCKRCDVATRFNDNTKKKFVISKEELSKLILIDKIPFTTLGKRFNVSDNAIRKRARKFGIAYVTQLVEVADLNPA